MNFKITKLEHSGIIIEKNQQKLVFDPVEFTEKLPEIMNVAAIIITHKHGDHFQPECIERILEHNPTARIFAVSDLEAAEIAGHPVEKVEAEVFWDLGDFQLQFFGHDHAAIIPGVVPCQNIGVVVNGTIVNPGDSFDLPKNAEPSRADVSDAGGTPQVEVLFVPSAAPWCKVPEGMEYIKRVQPAIAIPVHNAVLSDLGNTYNNNWLTQAATEVGTQLVYLQPGESFEI